MKNETAIGLLVGGAVVLLATSKRSGVVGQQPVYPNAGGALNPLNWFGGQGSGAMFQPGATVFNPAGPTYQPAAPYHVGSQPALTQGGGLSYDPYGAGGGAAPDYNYTASSPLPVPIAVGGVGYDYYPVMTPGGGFQDYTALAANSRQVAAASSPFYA